MQEISSRCSENLTPVYISIKTQLMSALKLPLSFFMRFTEKRTANFFWNNGYNWRNDSTALERKAAASGNAIRCIYGT
jgi:hypothetical protein